MSELEQPPEANGVALSSAPRGPIAWMAANSIAANLAMFVLLVGGLLFSTKVVQEVFPEFDLETVTVSVPYPGASPAEVEQGILLAIEDQTSGVDGVQEISSEALEGVGTVTLEMAGGADLGKALQDIKNEVDRIVTFPEEAEEPVVSLASRQRQVLSVLLHGEMPERSLRALGERLRSELLGHEGITLVELAAVRDLEIGVEISQEKLRTFGLTLSGVAQAIRASAVELPGGEVTTSAGEILIRTQERRELASEFADLAIVTTSDGSVVRLGELGTVTDGFAEQDIEALFNGEPAIELAVYRVGQETPLAVSSAATEVLEEFRLDLPPGVGATVWNDQSEVYRDRLDLLSRNALLGLGMVLLLLGLFLEPRVAFWVVMGILISVVGSFVVFPATGATINMISLFAFIVTLGIVVDDAIIVGENIFELREQGMPPLEAAIRGAQEIAGPVVFAVLTNIIAFLPLFFVPGAPGNLFRQIPAVVVSVFAISLVESLFILPAHLSHAGEPGRVAYALGAPNRWVTKQFDRFSEGVFQPFLTLALRQPYLAPALGIGLLAVTVGFIGGGRIRMSFLPRIDSDQITAQARLPVGSPMADARELVGRLLEGARQAEEEVGGGLLDGLYAKIGGANGSANELTVQAFLVSPEGRVMGGQDFAKEWRRVLGPVAGLEALTFVARQGPGASAKPIDIELSSPNRVELELAASQLSRQLAEYDGVSDIDDGTATGKRQISVSLDEAGKSLGLTSAGVAAELRASFFGAEALRQQRGRNEIKVLVRLPLEERERLSTVEDLMLRTPSGGEVPLAAVATLDEGRSYTSIRRREGRRTISVTGDVDLDVTDANTVLASVQETELPPLMERYEGLSFSLEGEQKSQRESTQALGTGLAFAMFAIFAMLAIPLKSYSLPLIVLSGAPFGIIGALLGHYLLGYGVSMISLFGIIALTGVVVNDSLVLVVTSNRYREEGLDAFHAVRKASVRRLRPILLTSLTTSMGLLPMMLETSVQARFLVPMAISLGFGVLFSTVVILVLVPSLVLIREDVIAICGVAMGREPAPGADADGSVSLGAN